VLPIGNTLSIATVLQGIDMKTISLKLPQHLHARLERAARSRQVSKSMLVREALAVFLDAKNQRRQNKKVSCHDLAGDLAGCLDGGPEDLATNPKYLEGFGQWAR
jgi:hypothetical protein